MTSESEDYRLITLSQGQVAKVSPEDYENLSRFKWNASWSPCTKSFYARGRIGGSSTEFLMHRVVLSLGKDNKMEGDHINGDTLDNRRINLRSVNRSSNAKNRKLNANSSTGIKGVIFRKDRGKYQARISVDGKRILLGYFNTQNEASEAYAYAAKYYHGEFERAL